MALRVEVKQKEFSMVKTTLKTTMFSYFVFPF